MCVKYFNNRAATWEGLLLPLCLPYFKFSFTHIFFYTSFNYLSG